MDHRLAAMFAFLSLIAPSSIAQNAQGTGDIGSWKNVHTANFGMWESICDRRGDVGAEETRCYIKYIDPFSLRPNYDAITFFLVPGDAPVFELAASDDLLFENQGVYVALGDEKIWNLSDLACVKQDICRIEGEAAKEFLTAMQKGATLNFDFVKGDTNFQRSWDLASFSDAFEDVQSAAASSM